MLKEDPSVKSAQGPTKKEKFNLRKQKIKEKQGRVLRSLSKPDFRPLHRYSTIYAFAGFITEQGIARLENNPDVERIYLDRIYHATLSESIPLINADDVHTLGYTGLGQTVAVIDTGVDLMHPDLGGPGCTISVTEAILGTPIESTHPYPNLYDATWTITQPGFANISVHFESIGLEKGYGSFDYMQILDASDNVVQTIFSGVKWHPSKYCDDMYDMWTASVPGDTIKVRLISDSSNACYGFKIDKLAMSTFTDCGQIVGGYDYVNHDLVPLDDDGHGTHVVGIIASQDPTYGGVAPGADIIAVKVLDSTGTGWSSDVIGGIDWCTVNKDLYGISVINLSLGGGLFGSECDLEADAQAINAAVSQGIFVAVASGNDGSTTGISAPACASGATSVGNVYDADVGSITWSGGCTDSTTAADQIVCHANRDDILDLLAPGALTTSLAPGGGFATYGGTSMASPHVAGVAALMLEANSALTPTQIRDALKSTGVGIYDSGTGLTFPRVDAVAAINSILPVSITLTTDGVVGLGAMAVGETRDTTPSGINDVETISVDVGPVDLAVRTALFSDGGDSWALGSTNGDNQVKWEFSPDASVWTTFLAPDTLYGLAGSVAEGGTQNLYLRLTAPSVATSANQHSVSVTIVATVP